MADDNKSIIGLIVVGLLVAVARLGDEFILIVRKISGPILEIGWFPVGGVSRGIRAALYDVEFSLTTIVLLLLAVFLVIATADYVLDEL